MSMACSSGICSHSVRVRTPVEDVLHAMRPGDELKRCRAFGAQAAVRDRGARIAFDVDDLLVLHVDELAASDAQYGQTEETTRSAFRVRLERPSLRVEAALSPNPPRSLFSICFQTGHVGTTFIVIPPPECDADRFLPSGYSESTAALRNWRRA